MGRSRFTEEQIIGVLHEGEAGAQIGERCRRHGISPTTFYRWRRKYGGLEVDEARRLKQLEDENRRLKKAAEGEDGLDGRGLQPTAADGYQAAIEGLLDRLDCWRVTGEGRPVQARTGYELLCRDHGYEGGHRGVVRHLRRRYGVPPVRALTRVETAPGVQAQHDWFEVRSRVGGTSERLSALVGVLSHSRARFPLSGLSAPSLSHFSLLAGPRPGGQAHRPLHPARGGRAMSPKPRVDLGAFAEKCEVLKLNPILTVQTI